MKQLKATLLLLLVASFLLDAISMAFNFHSVFFDYLFIFTAGTIILLLLIESIKKNKPPAL